MTDLMLSNQGLFVICNSNVVVTKQHSVLITMHGLIAGESI
jgi:hypothetical protein